MPILNNSHNIAAGGEVQTGLRMAGWNSMTVGYAYRWDHYTGTSLQGEYERGLNSAYVVDEVAVRPDFLKGIHRIALVPALRWDRFSDFGAQVSPKIGLVMNAGEEWLLSVKANYGRSFRAPTFNDLYWPQDAYTAGNPDLKPERANDFDAGAMLELPVWAGLGASFTWFGNTVTDLILWQPGADWVWRPANVGKAEIRGVETGLSFSPWKNLLTLSWNYTHLDARNKSGTPEEYDKQLPDRPDDMHKVTLQTRYAGISAIVDFLYVGMRYTTTSNNASLPAYRVFNIHVGYAWELARSRMELRGEVLNAGDEEYQAMAGFPVPGREFRVSLSFGWGECGGRVTGDAYNESGAGAVEAVPVPPLFRFVLISTHSHFVGIRGVLLCNEFEGSGHRILVVIPRGKFLHTLALVELCRLLHGVDAARVADPREGKGRYYA